MKERILLLGLVVLVSYFFIDMPRGTFSYSYDIDKTNLFYNEDKNQLKEDLQVYIDFVDDYIIPNSSYEMSYYLNENYDFLVYFAMDYILDNYEYYNDKIIYKDTNKYISIEEIYNITDKYFGVRDFYILVDNIIIDDNDYVELFDYNEVLFDLSIINIDLISSSNQVNAIVLYENEVKYSYLFDNINGVLKIKNIEVLWWRRILF